MPILSPSRIALRAALIAAFLVFPGAAFGNALFLIEGGGWGNGLGMSQWGAEGYALHGRSYEQILGHYYPHTRIGAVRSQLVRVLLADGQRAVDVGSGAPFLLIDARGRRFHVVSPAVHLTRLLRFGKTRLVPPVEVEPGIAPVTLNGAGYRGSLFVEASAGKLKVINSVPLERYLRGVVPSEMPWRWRTQAYEAQAVAARSYAIASLNPSAAFDVYADDRSQVYGGIASERSETNFAVDATAGQVLTFGGRVILAYYGANSGGRTAAVQDVFPTLAPEPYLVPVSDPFDSLGPNHRWRVALGSDHISQRLGMPVTDLRVEHNGSGRVSAVVLVGPHVRRTIAPGSFARMLGLSSTFFSVGVISLGDVPARSVYGQPLALQGFVRGIDGVVLQELLPGGAWHPVAHVATLPDGRFLTFVFPRRTTAYRLAVGRVAGAATEVAISRRIAVHADGNLLAGKVLPAAPVRIERKVGRGWQPIRGVAVGPAGLFRVVLARAGSYRVSSGQSGRFLASASPAVRVNR